MYSTNSFSVIILIGFISHCIAPEVFKHHHYHERTKRNNELQRQNFNNNNNNVELNPNNRYQNHQNGFQQQSDQLAAPSNPIIQFLQLFQNNLFRGLGGRQQQLHGVTSYRSYDNPNNGNGNGLAMDHVPVKAIQHTGGSSSYFPPPPPTSPITNEASNYQAQGQGHYINSLQQPFATQSTYPYLSETRPTLYRGFEGQNLPPATGVGEGSGGSEVQGLGGLMGSSQQENMQTYENMAKVLRNEFGVPNLYDDFASFPTADNNNIQSGQLTGAASEVAQIQLGPMNVDSDAVTLSGFSSGGAFVQQLLISHPSMFKGIGIFHQTFYRCGGGGGRVEDFDFLCTQLPSNYTAPRIPYDPQLALNDIEAYAAEGLIEDPANLINKRIYMYAGLLNEVFSIEMMLNTIRVLEPFIQNPEVIKTRIQNSQNLVPTKNFGDACDQPATSNFLIGNCNLNGPYEALAWLHGYNRIKRPNQNDKYNLNSFLSFDQSEFFTGPDKPHHMSTVGYVYIPNNCALNDQNGGNSNYLCLFHVYFHGCRTGSDYVGINHIVHSGYLELAELNNIIILFPQVSRTEINTLGCWDSFGNTGPFYATQQGAQIIITRRMILRILGSGGGGRSSGSGRAIVSSASNNNNVNHKIFRNNNSRNARPRNNSCTYNTDYSNFYLCQPSLSPQFVK